MVEVANEKVMDFLKNKMVGLDEESELYNIYRVALRAMRVVDAVEKRKAMEDMDDGK